MEHFLNKFNLPFSKSSNEIEALLKKHSKKLSPRSISKASPTLLRKIKKYEQELLEFGRPSNLQVMQINDQLQAGVFLKPDSAPLKTGAFIGLYTGLYELVLADESDGNHYAYDVLLDLKLRKQDLAFVRHKNKKLSTSLDYSIQTNAVNAGNFTRYINHTLYAPNIEAITKMLPDGTIEVFLFTLKTIRPGEQLLSSYGGQYWAVLPLIPEEITPRTFMLTKEGKIVRTEKPKPIDPEIEKKLLPLRQVIDAETIDLPSSIKTVLSKSKLPYVSKSLHQKIEDFEEVVLERALPKNLEIKKLKTKEEWGIFLSKNAKPLKKGSYIGVYGGEWLPSIKKASPYALPIKINKNTSIILDGSKKNNFSKYLLSAKEGNLKATLYKKRGPNGLYLVLTAKQDIQPGERLTFSL